MTGQQRPQHQMGGGGQFVDEDVLIHRDNTRTPWGFRLQGGEDSTCPLTVQRVFINTPAEGKIHRGDVVIAFEKYDVTTLQPKQVLEMLDAPRQSISLRIRRSEAQSKRLPSISDYEVARRNDPFRNEFAASDGTKSFVSPYSGTTFPRSRPKEIGVGYSPSPSRTLDHRSLQRSNVNAPVHQPAPRRSGEGYERMSSSSQQLATAATPRQDPENEEEGCTHQSIKDLRDHFANLEQSRQPTFSHESRTIPGRLGRRVWSRPEPSDVSLPRSVVEPGWSPSRHQPFSHAAPADGNVSDVPESYSGRRRRVRPEVGRGGGREHDSTMSDTEAFQPKWCVRPGASQYGYVSRRPLLEDRSFNSPKPRDPGFSGGEMVRTTLELNEEENQPKQPRYQQYELEQEKRMGHSSLVNQENRMEIGKADREPDRWQPSTGDMPTHFSRDFERQAPIGQSPTRMPSTFGTVQGGYPSRQQEQDYQSPTRRGPGHQAAPPPVPPKPSRQGVINERLQDVWKGTLKPSGGPKPWEVEEVLARERQSEDEYGPVRSMQHQSLQRFPSRTFQSSRGRRFEEEEATQHQRGFEELDQRQLDRNSPMKTSAHLVMGRQPSSQQMNNTDTAQWQGSSRSLGGQKPWDVEGFERPPEPPAYATLPRSGHGYQQQTQQREEPSRERQRQPYNVRGPSSHSYPTAPPIESVPTVNVLPQTPSSKKIFNPAASSVYRLLLEEGEVDENKPGHVSKMATGKSQSGPSGQSAGGTNMTDSRNNQQLSTHQHQPNLPEGKQGREMAYMDF